MSFLLTCPHCGIREVTDFAFGGEVSARPRETPSFRELCEYNYFRRNVAGVQREWWYHRSGCRTWFQAERDTRTNDVLRIGLPGELGPAGTPAAGAPASAAAAASPAAEAGDAV
jgi:heterotetrameric sarcosine oxidase delta subunit